MTVGLATGYYPPGKARYFVAVAYDIALVLLSRNRTLRSSPLVYELLVESNLFVAGLIALV